MIYNEFPVQMDDGMLVQLQEQPKGPENQFSMEGSRTPKKNADGELSWKVPVIITSGERMTLETVKCWAAENPVAGIEVGSLLNLLAPKVYVGITNDNKKFYGLKAAAIAKAGK